MTIFVEYPLAIHIALQMYVCVFVWNLMFWTHFIFIDMKMRINIVDLIYSRELAEPLYYIQCNALISVYQKLYSIISVHSALWSTMTFTPPKKVSKCNNDRWINTSMVLHNVSWVADTCHFNTFENSSFSTVFITSTLNKWMYLYAICLIVTLNVSWHLAYDIQIIYAMSALLMTTKCILCYRREFHQPQILLQLHEYGGQFIRDTSPMCHRRRMPFSSHN